MKLKDYITQFHRGCVAEFAVRTDLSTTILWQYFSGLRRPSQKTAERIEKETGGRVTVLELRGEDNRNKADGIQES